MLKPASQSPDPSASRRVESVDEFAHIDWIRSRLPAPPGDLMVGPGDDCAVWDCGGRLILMKVDNLIEGTHFQRLDPGAAGHATPEQIGRKAIARAVSDIAAMGGVPRFALVGAVVPASPGPALREGLMNGLLDACAQFGIALAGGDTTGAPQESPLMLCITLMGEMGGLKPVLRSGARHGDAIFVTGRLGGSLLAKHLSFQPRIKEGQWLAGVGASAMMDISDGLAQDLWQLCRASRVGATISRGQILVSEDAMEAASGDGRAAQQAALSDGEDYELLFTANEDIARRIEAEWPFDTPLTRIGQVTPLKEGEKPGAGLWIEDRGKILTLEPKGWRARL